MTIGACSTDRSSGSGMGYQLVLIETERSSDGFGSGHLQTDLRTTRHLRTSIVHPAKLYPSSAVATKLATLPWS